MAARSVIASGAWTLLLASCVAAAAVLAGACARRSPAPAAPSRPIRVAIAHYLSHAPTALADAEGDFRREGLDVELVRLESTGASTPALMKGEVDVVSGLLLIAHLNAIARGAKLRVVADKGHFEPGCAATAVVVRNGFADGKDLEDPAVLRTARAAAPILSFSEYLFDRLLRTKGMRFSDLVPANLSEPQAADAFLAGDLDLATLSEPNLSRVVSSGKARVWKNAQDVLPGGQLAYILFGPRLLENRDEGLRFVKAYLEGARRYNEGKTPRNLEVLAAFTGLPRERLEGACWQPIRADGRVNEDSLMDYQRWAVERGELAAVLPIEAVWDPSFVTGRAR